MPQLQREIGSYDARERIRLLGSFQTNGTGAPTILRDGATTSFTVARISVGLFTVTFTGEHPLPEKLIYEQAPISRAAVVTGSARTDAYVVKDSYNRSARTFQIVALSTPTVAVVDSTGERINFELVGSVATAGSDLL